MTRRIGYYALVAALLLACALLLLAGLRNQRAGRPPVQSPQTAASTSSAGSVLPTARTEGGGKVRVVDLTLDKKPETQPGPPTSLQLPENIRLSDVAEITGAAGQQILIFRDGSRLPVTPDVRSRLPGDLQLRLNYTRDN